MKFDHLNLQVFSLCAALLFLSCEPETLPKPSSDSNNTLDLNVKMQSKEKKTFSPGIQKEENSILFEENLQRLAINDIPPSECVKTKFSEVQWKYFSQLAGDPVATDWFERYLDFNHRAPLWGIGSDYFGEDGEYTQHVLKVKRDLERFWNTGLEIEVLGQHSSTLNNSEALLEILWRSVADMENKEDLLPEVEKHLQQNSLSSNLPENPIFSSEAYSNMNNQIIIGDGLVTMFAETGIDPKIVWTGILSHEWAHQIQMNFFEAYEVPNQPNYVDTRTVELEADFMSGYYMTHKRGGTYNWKRVEQFFSLFFQAGDCAYDDLLHHGTPQERMAATKAGNELAASAQKKGKILGVQEMHEYFLEVVLPGIN